ncbi:hypothetical protein CR513_58338, partial [Mucuna pruriens]
MEEEFGEIEVEYAPLLEGHEIDDEYEFDAPQFCDLTRHDVFWDAAEAEQWFELAGNYPPSPFLLKMRWRNSSGMKPEQDSNTERDNSTEYCKTKPLSKSNLSKAKDFSFMKPTASHLAKQKNASEVQTPGSLRIQRQNSSSPDGQLTKRQKLEAGYLRKVARLKHHLHFSHKKINEVDSTEANLAPKPNVTIAKKPNLVTATRAQRHKSGTADSSGPTQSSSQVLKARPLNKKISEGPAQVSSKMKTPRPTEFQEFHLRTSERALQNTSNNEKCKMNNNKLQGSTENKVPSKRERGIFRNIKVYPLEPNDKGSLNEPPTKVFSKLSLASEVKRTTKSASKEQQNSKGSKENRPRSLRQEQEK